MTQQFLKCDNPHCIYEENIDSIDESMIGKPCPNCGQNLLTEEDYKYGKILEKTIGFLKSLGLVSEHQGEGFVSVSLNPHKGKLNISEVTHNKKGLN